MERQVDKNTAQIGESKDWRCSMKEEKTLGIIIFYTKQRNDQR